MCFANVLTVRNTTKFHRKENIIRYFNIYRLQHQPWYEFKNKQLLLSPEESLIFFLPVTTVPKCGCIHIPTLTHKSYKC